MPNKRGLNQTLIAFSCDKDLLRALDLARISGQGRSAFVRQAIVNELRRLKLPASERWVSAPDRVRSVRYPPYQDSADALNEKPHPTKTCSP